jgi:hypothetical protein
MIRPFLFRHCERNEAIPRNDVGYAAASFFGGKRP